MPNWTYIQLEISGKPEELKKLIKETITVTKVDKVVNHEINNNAIMPYPEHFKEMDRIAKEKEKEYKNKVFIDNEESSKEAMLLPKDGFNSGGYEWCSQNWGSKWGFCNSHLEDQDIEDGSISIRTESPWTHPLGLMEDWSKKYPDLEFVYDVEEESNAFVGEMIFKNGECISDGIHEPTLEEIQERNGYSEEEMVEYYGTNWREQ
jgi:hypothetical protein